MALSKQAYSYNHTATSRQYQYKIMRREVWQGYLLSHEERSRIDMMMGRALLDEAFCEQLVHQRDVALMEYGFSSDTHRWLCAIEAHSLTEFAQAIAQ